MFTIPQLHTYLGYLSLVFICQPHGVCLSFISLSSLRPYLSDFSSVFWGKMKEMGIRGLLTNIPVIL